MKTKAIGYVRVSTEEQAAEGYSLEAQRAKLAGYAVASDLELVAVLADEGISGKRTDNRPGLQDALRRLEAGEAAALVVVKLDRLSRSTADVLALVERSGREGWGLHSLAERLDTASAMGRFVVTIFAALAQAEREVIGERTKAAMSHMKASGLRVGAVPFGFDLAADGRTLAPNAAELAVVAEVRAAVEAGRKLSAVARDLNARGVLTKRGRKWTHTQVGNVLAA
jgi:DNA invertase Pin-like site-specific DNA recombinase